MSGTGEHSTTSGGEATASSGRPRPSRLPGRALSGRLDSFLGGNPFAGIAGHVVVVGAGPTIAGMMTRLEQDTELPPEVIVVVPPGPGIDRERIRKELDLVGARRRRVHLVIADPDDATWDWIRLDHASEVVVVPSSLGSDLDVAGMAIEIERRLHESPPPLPPLVLALESAANAAAVRTQVNHDEHIHMYVMENLAAGALARIAAHPEFSSFLTGTGRTNLYAVGASGLADIPFAEILPRMESAIPVGLINQSGHVEFLPTADRPVSAKERIVVFAANGTAARVRSDPSDRPTLPSATVGAEDADVPQLLIVGWNQVAAGILERRSAAGLPVSEVTIFSDDRPENFPENIPTPRHFRGDPLDEESLAAACSQLNPEVVVVTGAGTDNDASLTAMRVASAGASHVLVDRRQPTADWAQWAGSDEVELLSAADILASRLAGSLTDPLTTIARREAFSDPAMTFERIRINSIPPDQPVTLASLYMGLLPSRSVPIAVSRYGTMLAPEDPFQMDLDEGDEVLLLSRRLP